MSERTKIYHLNGQGEDFGSRNLYAGQTGSRIGINICTQQMPEMSQSALGLGIRTYCTVFEEAANSSEGSMQDFLYSIYLSVIGRS